MLRFNLGQLDQAEDRCLRPLQLYLAQQGALSYPFATGALNDETRRALAARYGVNWENYPGGTCGILTSIQLSTGVPATIYTPQQPSFSITPATAIAVVGGIALLIFALRR